MNKRNETLKKAVANIAQNLELSELQIKEIIGMGLSEIINNQDKKAQHKILELIELYQELSFAYGGDFRVMMLFLKSPNKLFNAVPIEMMQGGHLTDVLTTMRSMRIQNGS